MRTKYAPQRQLIPKVRHKRKSKQIGLDFSDRIDSAFLLLA